MLGAPDFHIAFSLWLIWTTEIPAVVAGIPWDYFDLKDQEKTIFPPQGGGSRHTARQRAAPGSGIASLSLLAKLANIDAMDKAVLFVEEKPKIDGIVQASGSLLDPTC